MWKNYLKNHLQKYGSNFISTLKADKTYDIGFFQECFEDKINIILKNKFNENNVVPNKYKELTQFIFNTIGHVNKNAVLSPFEKFQSLLEHEFLVDVVIGVFERLCQYEQLGLCSIDVLNGPVGLQFKYEYVDDTNSATITSFPVSALSRKLHHGFSHLLIQDIKLIYDASIDKELTQILCEGIVEEIIRDTFNINNIDTLPSEFAKYEFNHCLTFNGVDFYHPDNCVSIKAPLYISLYMLWSSVYVDQDTYAPKTNFTIRYARGKRYDWYSGICSPN